MRTIWSATRRGNWAVSLPKFFKNLFSCSVTPSYNHVPLENSPTRKYQLVMTLWRCNANGRKKTLYAFYKTHWCKSRQFLGVQRKSCPKLLYYVFIYHVAIDWKMANMVLDIWFLIIQLKKVRKALQEHCQKPAGSVLLRICLKVVRISIHIPTVAVSKEPQT